MSFNKDRSLEAKFEPQIKFILADQFITKNVEADLEQATDFAVYTVEPFKVAVRLRRHFYFGSFRHQFTVRWSRPSGVKTEIHKIREGKVDYFLYGFVDEPEGEVIQYFIADLTVFRETNPEPFQIYSNKPYDSDLAVYNISQFPLNFIVKFWSKI